MPTAADLQRLGDAVLRRRQELNDRTQTSVTEHGGPSDTTLSKIEKGLPPPPSSATLRKLDLGLDWEPGSAAAVLYGRGEPVPRAGSREPVEPTRLMPRLGGGTLRRLLIIRDELDVIIDELRGQ